MSDPVQRFDDGQWPTVQSEVLRLAENAIQALEYGLQHSESDPAFDSYPSLETAALKASGYLADIRELVRV